MANSLNSPGFVRPVDALSNQDQFSATEVGVTHPYTDAYVRLTDDGDVELVAIPGLAIIMHPSNRSITLVADSIKFVTKDQGGLRWNAMAFNDQASKFTEPALIPYTSNSTVGLYDGTQDFLGDS